MAKLVLASSSPRRIELMRLISEDFEVRAPVDDALLKNASDVPEVFVIRNAVQKSFSVANTSSEEWVLGADTVVVCQGRKMGKPNCVEEAEEMLWFLQSKWHQVYTGVCLAFFPGGKTLNEVETTWVKFLPLPREICRQYALTGEGMDKAGGYAAQGLGSRYIESIEGCFYNVVGLPISRIWRMLREVGYESR